ncbi:MAG: G-D-S-L family lipolytic protein [Gelidibacter sp.]|nr:G-D-S-L family lipolytic protein [Gelidibacter sp.]
MKKFKYLFFIAPFIFSSCDDDDFGVSPIEVEVSVPVTADVTYTSGTANFSKFVSVGNSLTAGYSDGALFIDGQTNSFPNILAKQFVLAGGGNFTQPLMKDNLGGLLLGGNQITSNRLFLSFTSGSPSPIPISGTPTTEVSSLLAGPFSNMGVPGAKSYHLVASGYGNVAGVATGLANPYFARMASSSSASVIGDAVAQSPTFFSLWIGNNDILGFATSGGVGIDQKNNLNPATYGSNDITDPNVFASVYNSLLTALTANGTKKGIVSNLPSVTTIPYFTTVPYNAIPLDAATAAMLNQAFAPYNGGLLQLQGLGAISAAEVNRRTVRFTAGKNPVLILDENLTNLTIYNPALTNMRQATSADLLVLTSRTFLGTTVGGNASLINGVSVPLADKWVLTPEEQAAVGTAISAYNTTIAALAQQYGLAFFDANALLKQLVNVGITQNGIKTTGVYATGGGFSLDGVHPSPRGYAIIANGMIDAINLKYGSNLPKVNVGNYKGLYIN